MINWQQYVRYFKRNITFTNHQLLQLVCVFVLIFSLIMLAYVSGYGRRYAALRVRATFAIALWSSFIIGVTLLNRREMAVHLARFDVWNTIQSIVKGDTFAQYQAVNNIVLFVPFGVLLCVNGERCGVWWRHFLICFVCSLLIELEQFITGRGMFDVADLITNLTGGMIGYALARVVAVRK